jgi:transposase-like protein
MGKRWVRHPTEVRERVRQARRSGLSIKRIAHDEGLSSSTVSLWVRDIALSGDQVQAIAKHRVELSGLSYARRAQQVRERWRREAEEAWTHWSDDPLFMLGVGMYWGEGSKRIAKFEITNADPGFIQAWVRWCARFAPHERIRMEVGTHPDVFASDVEEFWRPIVGPTCAIRVLPIKAWKRHDGQSIRLPYGVAKIYLSHGVEWHTKMLEWLRLAAVA